jgi:hypothetical protein
MGGVSFPGVLSAGGSLVANRRLHRLFFIYTPTDVTSPNAAIAGAIIEKEMAVTDIPLGTSLTVVVHQEPNGCLVAESVRVSGRRPALNRTPN